MDKQEKIIRESEKLDDELISVLLGISTASERMAIYINRLRNKPWLATEENIKHKKEILKKIKRNQFN